MKKDLANTIFYRVKDFEIFRLFRRGFWNIISVLIIVSYLLAADYLKQFWPEADTIPNKGKFHFWSLIIAHNSFFIFVNLIYMVIYKLKLPFFEQYKTYKENWPWEDNYEEWIEQLKKTIKSLIINFGIMIPLTLIPSYITDESHFTFDNNDLPTITTMIKHICFSIVVEDVLFYFSHKLLHVKAIYPLIHKQHHEYRRVVSIASEYAHPVEYVFSNLVPSNLGLLILGKRVHIYTYFVWMIIRMTETSDGHSGYEFPWTPFRLIPFSGSQEFHNYHHLNFNGNYGSFTTIMDRLFNTVNKGYLTYIDNVHKKNEIESSEQTFKENEIYDNMPNKKDN